MGAIAVHLPGRQDSATRRLLANQVRQPERVQDSLEVVYVLDNDCAAIPPLLADLKTYLVRFGICNAADCIRVGVALEEAISNAIHHGNLELASDLRDDGGEAYHALAAERRRQPPYMHRRVHISARFSVAEAAYTVRDEGPGFDPQSIPDPTDPANLERASGRGLLLIRAFMDEVTYNAAGNELTMVKRKRAERGE